MLRKTLLATLWAGALISALAHTVARRVLRNMHDSFCRLNGWQDLRPAAQRLLVPASRCGGLGMNFGGLAGADRSWG